MARVGSEWPPRVTKPQGPADEGKPLSWRERLLPTTAVGMTTLVLAFAVGAAFSGTVLYAYYEFRLNRTERLVDKFVTGFDDRFDRATKTIEAERENAKADISEALEPLRQIRAEGETLVELAQKVEPSMWFVRTLDEFGQPSVGSGFVVASDADQSLVLTSYSTVKAATRTPGPTVFARRGGQEVKATVWTWHEERDLALLVLDRGSTPRLQFAPRTPAVKIGERLFAVSGLGATGAAITQGFVADVSSAGIQHDASIGTAFRGGPLVNSKGAVLAVASRAYAPLGFQSESVFFGVPIRAACEKVLSCPGGDVSGPGARQRPARATTTTTSSS